MSELSLFFNELEKKSKNLKRKIFLIRSLKSLLAYSVSILKDFTASKEINGKFILTSSKYQNKTITFILQREFAEIVLRRTLIFMAWSFFEDFFQKETKTKKIGRELLKGYFGEANKIPTIINYFYGIRNSIHSNGIYHGKKLICKIGSDNYELKDNQKVILEYLPILNIIKESLNLL